MLSIQAVRGLPRLRAPGIVPCIISFSRINRNQLMAYSSAPSRAASTVINEPNVSAVCAFLCAELSAYLLNYTSNLC